MSTLAASAFVGSYQKHHQAAHRVEGADECEIAVGELDPSVDRGAGVCANPDRPTRKRDCGGTVLITRNRDDLWDIGSEPQEIEGGAKAMAIGSMLAKEVICTLLVFGR